MANDPRKLMHEVIMRAIAGPQPIVIPMEDPIIHTAEHPWCNDETCPCQAVKDEPAELARLDELDQSGTHAPDCRCAWCEPQERNATTQCSDGSWW